MVKAVQEQQKEVKWKNERRRPVELFFSRKVKIQIGWRRATNNQTVASNLKFPESVTVIVRIRCRRQMQR